MCTVAALENLYHPMGLITIGGGGMRRPGSGLDLKPRRILCRRRRPRLLGMYKPSLLPIFLDGEVAQTLRRHLLQRQLTLQDDYGARWARMTWTGQSISSSKYSRPGKSYGCRVSASERNTKRTETCPGPLLAVVSRRPGAEMSADMEGK